MVSTPSQTPRSGFLPIPAARAQALVKPGGIQAVPVGSVAGASPVSTMTTTPVSQISEVETTPTEEKRSRIKVGAPFDVPRASIRAKCPSWSDTPTPKVWHPKRPAQQCEGTGEKTGNVSKKEKSVSNDKGKSKERKEKCSPSPKGRARSDSPLLSRVGLEEARSLKQVINVDLLFVVFSRPSNAPDTRLGGERRGRRPRGRLVLRAELYGRLHSESVPSWRLGRLDDHCGAATHDPMFRRGTEG